MLFALADSFHHVVGQRGDVDQARQQDVWQLDHEAEVLHVEHGRAEERLGIGEIARLEARRAPRDCDGDPENMVSRRELLDMITLYWLTNSGASSARLYFESMGSFRPMHVTLPVGMSIFPKEIIKTPRKWAEQVFSDIIHWNKLPRGGHFAAFEQPELFVAELRSCFAKLR